MFAFLSSCCQADSSFYHLHYTGWTNIQGIHGPQYKNTLWPFTNDIADDSTEDDDMNNGDDDDNGGGGIMVLMMTATTTAMIMTMMMMAMRMKMTTTTTMMMRTCNKNATFRFKIFQSLRIWQAPLLYYYQAACQSTSISRLWFPTSWLGEFRRFYAWPRSREWMNPQVPLWYATRM